MSFLRTEGNLPPLGVFNHIKEMPVMNTKTMLMVACLLAGGLFSTARAQDAAAQPATAPATAAASKPAPSMRNALPQDQEYQRVLHKYMGTLTEKDFDHGVTAKVSVPPLDPNVENQYRTLFIAMVQQPHVGGKRGIGAVNSPALCYLLSTIEANDRVIVPPVWEESLASFIKWDTPGNPFYNNKALKMRAFVAAAVKMMMVDDYMDAHRGEGVARADWNAYKVICAAGSYPVFKDELPPEVQKAYEAGLMRLARKLLASGVKAEACDYDMSVPVALWYVARATGDAEFAKEAQAFARKLCTDPQYFHPAGYWVERGGLDVGFGGMANFWSVWLALASDWDFAKETVAKAYRLRAHLSLPEPDGKLTGPSEFNNRIGSPACSDQWDWDGTRDPAAAMVTDEALCQMRLPDANDLAGAMTTRVQTIHGHLYGGIRNPPYRFPSGKYTDENGKGRYLENDELRGGPWAWYIFPNGQNHPVEVVPGHEFYRQGAYAHLVDMQKQNSPMLKSPFERPGDFITNFGNAFIVAKQATYAAIIHAGPVGVQTPDDGMIKYPGPMGFGGGELAAFWTPATGSVILGRRSAMSFSRNLDVIDQWRTWPINAVSGVTTEGKLFTSARIAAPEVAADVQPAKAVVKVSGTIPATIVGQDGGIAGKIDYARTFTIDAKGVAVATTIAGDGKDRAAELCETLPVFLDDPKLSTKRVAPKVAIEFQAAGTWSPASEAYADNVKAVRINRYDGGILITFDRPRRVKLSPAEWVDKYLTAARCRTILIDLLESGDKPAAVKSAAVAYEIQALPK